MVLFGQIKVSSLTNTVRRKMQKQQSYWDIAFGSNSLGPKYATGTKDSIAQDMCKLNEVILGVPSALRQCAFKKVTQKGVAQCATLSRGYTCDKHRCQFGECKMPVEDSDGVRHTHCIYHLGIDQETDE